MRFLASLVAVAFLTTASVVVWRFAIGGLAEHGSESSLPGEQASGDPTGQASSLAALPEGTKFIYREFGPRADTIWAALADDPSQRVPLAQVEHSAGWGIRASLSADGARLAYVAVSSEDGTGRVWLMELDGSNRRRLAEAADARIAPVWAPDGSAVAFVRSTEVGPSLAQAGVDGSYMALVVGGALGFYPIGYAPDGRSFYYAQVTTAGTDFGAVSLLEGGARLFAHASDYIARDWRLSPDGQHIAYLAPQVAGGRVHYQAFVVAVAGGAPTAVVPQASADDHLGPAWHPNGHELTVGRASAGDNAALEMVRAATGEGVQTLAGPQRGFDVPVAWSPDGGYLAVRTLDGDSTRNPGRERDGIITASGKRQQIIAKGDVEFIGWLLPAP